MSGQGATLLRAFMGGALIFGMGYGIMKVTTPTEEQLYNKLSPELRKQVDAKRSASARQAAYAEQVARAREQEDAPAIWAEGSKARDLTPAPAAYTSR